MKNLYLFATALLMSLAGMAQTDMVVVSPFTDSIWTIDTTNLTQSVGVALTSTSGTVTGCNGLAKRPCTSDLYVIYKVSGATGRFLGIVDPTTGVITEIGNTGDNVAGITFGSENHLYAVTGDGASASESLFKVNIATGAMTLFTALGNGDDGETIAFNPDDGKIYHWSGLSTQVMESIDTATGAVNNIAISGFDYSEAFGAKYIGNGEFYLTNINSEILVMNTSGVASTPFFTTTNIFRGMEFEANPGDICNQLMYTVSPYTDSIWTVDTTNFSQSLGIALTSSSGTVTGCNGLSTHPCTGDLYVVYKISGVVGRFLGIVDPTTGVITEVGNMGDNVAGITFGSANHLYAVTGDGGTVSESLFKVNIATGAMTLFTALGSGSDGETIAFNPDDSKIYHWSGSGTQVMESIDTTSGAVTNIPMSGFTSSPEYLGAKYIGNGQFMLSKRFTLDMIIMNTSGFGTLAGTSVEPYKGLEFPLNNPPVPVASAFTYTTNNLTATFTDASTGPVTDWFWDYGDGTTSTMQNPVHTYTSNGSYIVCLTTTGPCGTATHCDTIMACAVPVAGWSYTSNLFSASFTDASSATVFSRIWDFGDGNTSTQLNPTHFYSTAGTYTVCLTVTDSCGTDSTCGTVNIAGCPPIAADWSASTTGLQADFTDMSTGTLYFYNWDFGDGNTSFQQNPSHTYAAPGNYTVCLIVADSCSADTFCNSIALTCPAPVADWSATSSNFTAGFTDNSSASVFSRLWDFGDGNTSTLTNPVHTYSALGTYTVCLTVTDSCGSDSSCGTVIIDCPAIAADWSATTTDLTADFTDLSSGSLFFYAWDFGDGTTDFSQNPSHTYTAAGTYTVCLIVADSCSADTLCNSITVTNPVGPVNDSICNAIPLVFGPNGPFSVANAGAQAGEPVPPIGTGLNFCQSQDGWCDGGGFVNEPFIQNSVWFTFVAPPSGNVTINTDNSYDTQIAVYSSTSCDSILAGNYTLEGANDDNPNAFTLFSSEVTVTCLTPGGTYWLQVDGYDGDEGPLNILLIDNLYSAQAMITSTTDTICPGDPSTLTASAGAGFGYSWTPTGDTTQSITVTTGGIYEVMVTDTNGCVAIGTRSIFQLNVPNVGLNPGDTAIFCTGDSVLLSGSGGGQSQWFLNGLPISGATTNMFWASTEGIYNMTKTNQNGCSDSAAVGVTVLEDPCLVGLNAATFTNDLSVYPSPVAHTLTVSFTNVNNMAVRLSLFAQDGRLVYTNNPSVGQGQVTLNIDMTEYSSGIYLMQIQQGTDLITRRVVKD